MPESRLEFQPGVNIELSETAARGGFSDCNLIRFKTTGAGLPARGEKIGGWKRISDTALTGACRALHWWVDLLGLAWLAAGTHRQLALYQNGVLYDISPATLQPGTASSMKGILYGLRIWSLDNFGQILLAVPSGGGLYQWIPDGVPGKPATAAAPATAPTAGSPKPATLVASAPQFNQGMIVAMPQRIVITFGSSLDQAMTIDPLLLRWSDIGDYTAWTVSTTNQAGSFRLSRGSRIVAALQYPLNTLVWTNLDLWQMTYIGFPLVFSTTQIGSLCGLIAQNALCALGATSYWMSDHGFFSLGGGGVQQIPCTVWDKVFNDLDQDNQDKCLAAPNYKFSEIFWFYPSLSGGTGEIDSYVKYNIMENVWDYGKLARTAWTDQNNAANLLGDGQFGVDLDGIVQQHEVSRDADGKAMTGVKIRSAYIDVVDGSEIILVNRLIPDFLWEGAAPEINVKLLFRNFPGDTPTIAGPFPITPSTDFVTVGTTKPPAVGIRGREVALEIDCDALDTWFRLGTPRLRQSPDGKM